MSLIEYLRKQSVLFLIVFMLAITPKNYIASAKSPCDFSSLPILPTSLQGLLKLNTSAESLATACGGFHFEGTGDKILDEFVVPDGLYRITFKGEEGIVRGSRVAGDCGISERETSIFMLLLAHDKTGRAETVFYSRSCKLLIEATPMIGAWSIDIQPLELVQ